MTAPRRWPFTDDEARSLLAAYEALTRVGNATADSAVNGPDTGHWDPLLDLGHHHLGLVILMGRVDGEPPAAVAEPQPAAVAEPPRITCPDCGRSSPNPNDIAQGYCPACHWWTSDPVLGPARRAERHSGG